MMEGPGGYAGQNYHRTENLCKTGVKHFFLITSMKKCKLITLLKSSVKECRYKKEGILNCQEKFECLSCHSPSMAVKLEVGGC